MYVYKIWVSLYSDDIRKKKLPRSIFAKGLAKL